MTGDSGQTMDDSLRKPAQQFICPYFLKLYNYSHKALKGTVSPDLYIEFVLLLPIFSHVMCEYYWHSRTGHMQILLRHSNTVFRPKKLKPVTFIPLNIVSTLHFNTKRQTFSYFSMSQTPYY